MITHLRSALIVSLLLLVFLPGTLAAQDLDATVNQLEISNLTGIETAVSRTYAMDVSDMIASIKDEEGETDDGIREGPILMLLLVAEFDSPENAATAFTTLHERMQQQLETTIPEEELDIEEITELGESAVQFTGLSGSTTRISAVIAHDDDWIYLSIVISEDESAATSAHDLVDFSLRQSSSDDQPMYIHTGRSEGGFWAKLPGSTNSALLAGTQPIFDNQLLPPPD